MKTTTVIIADDRAYYRRIIRELLTAKIAGYDLKFRQTNSASDVAKEVAAAGPENVSLVITDGFFASAETAIDVFDQVRGLACPAKIILYSLDQDMVSREAARRNHAPAEMFFDQIGKGKEEELLAAVRKALA